MSEQFPSSTFSNYNELIESLSRAKEYLGLSNAFCDDVGGMADGHTDKMLGPTRAKNIGPYSLGVLCMMFAVRFRMEVDPTALRQMQEKWEGRDTSQIRSHAKRLSMAALNRAKPMIFSEIGKTGGKARIDKIKPRRRSEIAANAANARWRKFRRAKRLAAVTRDADMRGAKAAGAVRC